MQQPHSTPNTHKIARDKFIAYLKTNIAYLKRRNSILALKSSYIKQKHDIVNIVTIVVSTLLTCFETIKLDFDMVTSTNLYIRRSATIVPILLTSYIAISMSILKFCRYTDQLEENTKVNEKVVFVICRLRRVVEDAHMTMNVNELQTIKQSYSKNPFDLYIDARESLDRTLKYTDVLKYGKILDDWVQDIDSGIRWWHRVFCCCRKRRRKEHDEAADDTQNHRRSLSLTDIDVPNSSPVA